MRVKNAKRAVTWATVLGLTSLQMVRLGMAPEPNFGQQSAVTGGTLNIQRMQSSEPCEPWMIQCPDGSPNQPPPSDHYYGDYYTGGAYTTNSATHSYMDQAYAQDANAYVESAWAWEDVNAVQYWPAAVVGGVRAAYVAARAFTQTSRIRQFVVGAARFARDVAVGVVAALLAGFWNNMSANPDYWGPTSELEFLFDYATY
jgi:hypothetical protein